MTSYDVATENRALLRWSLWEAQNKRCYICRDPFDFRHTQIDHIIPKSTLPVVFNKLWAQFGHGMANNGIHSINNLRAACADCNSSGDKGSIRFSDHTLDITLAKSPVVTETALSVQRKILRSGDVGRAAIVLASASTTEQYELIWDFDVSQALMAATYRASQILQSSHTQPVAVLTAPYQVQLAHDGKSARLLAAMQLASGLSPADLATAVVERSVEHLDNEIARAGASNRNPLFGANAGTTDWHGASFSVAIDSIEIEDDKVSYSCRVEFVENVSVVVSAQSADGSSLEDTQSDLTVEGHVSVVASTKLGHSVRSSPRVDAIEYVEEDFFVEDL